MRGTSRGEPERGNSPCRRRGRLSSSLSFRRSRWSAVMIVLSAVADPRGIVVLAVLDRGDNDRRCRSSRLNADRDGVARVTRGRRRRPLTSIAVSSSSGDRRPGMRRGVAPPTRHLSPRLLPLSVPLTRGAHSHKSHFRDRTRFLTAPHALTHTGSYRAQRPPFFYERCFPSVRAVHAVCSHRLERTLVQINPRHFYGSKSTARIISPDRRKE